MKPKFAIIERGNLAVPTEKQIQERETEERRSKSRDINLARKIASGLWREDESKQFDQLLTTVKPGVMIRAEQMVESRRKKIIISEQRTAEKSEAEKRAKRTLYRVATRVDGDEPLVLAGHRRQAGVPLGVVARDPMEKWKP